MCLFSFTSKSFPYYSICANRQSLLLMFLRHNDQRECVMKTFVHVLGIMGRCAKRSVYCDDTLSKNANKLEIHYKTLCSVRNFKCCASKWRSAHRKCCTFVFLTNGISILAFMQLNFFEICYDAVSLSF